MSRIFFACSGKSKNFVSTVGTYGINLVYAELAACECACFIEYECICFCKSLNIFAALDEYTDFGCRTDTRIVGERYGNNNSTRT